MLRAHTVLCFLFIYGFAAMSVRAQPNVERPRANNVDQLVSSNIEFFEHLLTSLATLSGVPRQDYLQHLKMNGAQERILSEAATSFKAREDVLRQSANAILSQGSGPEQSFALGQVRAQRSQLLLQSATKLMQSLDAEGVARLADRIEQVNALNPKRAGRL